MENDELLYAELLRLLKQKDKEKQESTYKQIELEITYTEPPMNIEEKIEKDESRGVVIIETN